MEQVYMDRLAGLAGLAGWLLAGLLADWQTGCRTQAGFANQAAERGVRRLDLKIHLWNLGACRLDLQIHLPNPGGVPRKGIKNDTFWTKNKGFRKSIC